MPTEKQRREAARRQLEHKLQQRAEHEAARKRFTLIASVVGTIVVIVAVVVVVVVLAAGGNDKKKKSTADDPTVGSPSPSTSASASAGAFTQQKTSGPCTYMTADGSKNTALKDVGMPPDPDPTPKPVLTVRFATNRGTIEATLDGTSAPCTVQAISYLIEKKFYDNTPCPRVVDGGIFVVQCGSGGTTTAGGPTFTIPDENLSKADYSAGAIAIANTGQANTGSSQFFFITKNSNSGLQKAYTVVGHVSKGLGILQKVAAGGNDGSSGSNGGGAPKLGLTFKSVTITSATHGKIPSTGPSPTLVPAA